MACGAQLGTDYGLGGVEASVCLCVASRRRDAELKIEMMLLTVNITGWDMGQARGTDVIFSFLHFKLYLSLVEKILLVYFL